ncbi:hypothetical protein ABZY34_04880 [Streptomyces virginiae]|uniref:hypothetical protein n=1 Tax=Streptomyces virginiae TaxID=1961 RepID=UPI0033B4DE0D
MAVFDHDDWSPAQSATIALNWSSSRICVDDQLLARTDLPAPAAPIRTISAGSGMVVSSGCMVPLRVVFTSGSP